MCDLHRIESSPTSEFKPIRKISFSLPRTLVQVTYRAWMVLPDHWNWFRGGLVSLTLKSSAWNSGPQISPSKVLHNHSSLQTWKKANLRIELIPKEEREENFRKKKLEPWLNHIWNPPSCCAFQFLIKFRAISQFALNFLLLETERLPPNTWPKGKNKMKNSH